MGGVRVRQVLIAASLGLLGVTAAGRAAPERLLTLAAVAVRVDARAGITSRS
jgi:hypothetical protein